MPSSSPAECRPPLRKFPFLLSTIREFPGEGAVAGRGGKRELLACESVAARRHDFQLNSALEDEGSRKQRRFANRRKSRNGRSRSKSGYRPGSHDAIYAGVGYQVAHMFVVMDNDPQVHATDCYGLAVYFQEVVGDSGGLDLAWIQAQTGLHRSRSRQR
jgi:hypothetical protein